jgi:hypothetical protein
MMRENGPELTSGTPQAPNLDTVLAGLKAPSGVKIKRLKPLIHTLPKDPREFVSEKHFPFIEKGIRRIEELKLYSEQEFADTLNRIKDLRARAAGDGEGAFHAKKDLLGEWHEIEKALKSQLGLYLATATDMVADTEEKLKYLLETGVRNKEYVDEGIGWMGVLLNGQIRSGVKKDRLEATKQLRDLHDRSTLEAKKVDAEERIVDAALAIAKKESEGKGVQPDLTTDIWLKQIQTSIDTVLQHTNPEDMPVVKGIMDAYQRRARKFAAKGESDLEAKEQLRLISGVVNIPVHKIIKEKKVSKLIQILRRLDSKTPEESDKPSGHPSHETERVAAAKRIKKSKEAAPTNEVVPARYDDTNIKTNIETLASRGVSKPEITGYELRLNDLLASYNLKPQGPEKLEAFHALEDFAHLLADQVGGYKPNADEHKRRRAHREALLNAKTIEETPKSQHWEAIPQTKPNYDFTELDRELAVQLKNTDPRMVAAAKSLKTQRDALEEDINKGIFVGNARGDIETLTNTVKGLGGGLEPIFSNGTYIPKSRVMIDGQPGWEFVVHVGLRRTDLPQLVRDSHFEVHRFPGKLTEAIRELNLILEKPVANTESFVDPLEETSNKRAPFTRAIEKFFGWGR